MIMFYKINDNYYVLVGNKYMEVKFTVENGEVQATPKNGKYIERSSKVNAIPQPFDEEFRKKLKNKGKSFGENNRDSRDTEYRNRLR